mgnify:FL=1|tara:strand:- start:6361 stop:6711 length:351 start_codon:yes stop_codon:yes gene_type:complete
MDEHLTELISFDIDGTLEVGDPPGCIDMNMVREAKEKGYIIGSCSDRTVTNQKRIWSEQGIEVSFTVVKHQLETVKDAFDADHYYHIGDTNIDKQYADQAGFTFYLPEDSVSVFWG